MCTLLSLSIAPAVAAHLALPGCTANSQQVEHVVCGATDVAGGAGGVIYQGNTNLGGNLPASFVNGHTGAMYAAGAGIGGIHSSAGGHATEGEIHLSAFANNGQYTQPEFYNNGLKGSSYGKSEIVFADGGTLGGSPNMEVLVRLFVTMDGAFSGSGEAQTTVILQHGNDMLFYASDWLINQAHPSAEIDHTYLLHGGDNVHFFMDMYAYANSTNDGYPALVESSADVSHTGRFFFDVLTPGVAFTSYSGHNYSFASTVPGGVPEPGAWLLMLTGFAAVGLALRRQMVMADETRAHV